MLDVYAAHRHHVRHLAPIADELERRGVELRRWSKRGDSWPMVRAFERARFETAIVAGWTEARELPDARLVYVEHGAGQRYIGVDDRGYAGAHSLEHVELFLSPNERVSARWRARYPHAAVETVGIPALDPMLGPGSTRVGARPDTDIRTVAITAHWRCLVVPETKPALPYYEPALSSLLERLRASGLRIVGHAHPRALGEARRLWARLGVDFELDPDEILRSSSLLIADNTSLLYEAAAVGLPSLSLNAPWYRRDVHHGLRFWSHVPGLECDRTEELFDRTLEALEDAPSLRAKRDRAARRAYSLRDGAAASRAADAIERII